MEEIGTLYRIRNLLHRTALTIDPEKNRKAAEDLLVLVLHGHIPAAAKQSMDAESDITAFTPVLQCVRQSQSLAPTLLLPMSAGENVDGVELYAREVM